jgi:hypothetical protein
MMGQQSRTGSLFYYFRLEEQIPNDHLLRMIDDRVDFSFVREESRQSCRWKPVRRRISRLPEDARFTKSAHHSDDHGRDLLRESRSSVRGLSLPRLFLRARGIS